MESFSRGDLVSLVIDGVVVAKATVVKIEPTDLVSQMVIGVGRLGVFIESVFEPHLPLPIKNKKSSTVGEAIDSLVIWDCADVFLSEPTISTRVSVASCSAVRADIPVDVEIPVGDSSHADRGGKEGPDVYLYVSTRIVAKGKMISSDPKGNCHNITLGSERLKVQVTDVFFPLEKLPFPHEGACTLGESLDTFIMWPKIDVSYLDAINQMMSSASGRQAGDPHVSLPNSNSTASESVGRGKEVMVMKDLADRANWINESVLLFCPDRISHVGSGIITVSHCAAPVGNEPLGDDHVGVMVISVLNGIYFPNLRYSADGVPDLIRWPVSSAKLKGDGRFLGDIFQPDAENIQDVFFEDIMPKNSTPEKRAYDNSKRSKFDPEEKKRRQQSTRAFEKTTDESIDEIKLNRCCGDRCLLNMSREDMEDVRKDYFGLTCNEKVTHIMTLFHNRQQEVVKMGKFVLKTRLICAKAFYLIHGFGQTQFYRYKRKFDDGEKIGFHSNKGTIKTREKSMIARAYFERLLTLNAEPMPHLVYQGKNGSDTIEYRFALSYSFKDLYEELKYSMEEAGEVPVIENTVRTIWRRHYANYKFPKSGTAFAKCDPCTRFKESLTRERNKDIRERIERERYKHLQEQQSRRSLYYSHRLLAKSDPTNYLCIIHDKMDQAKTWIPRLVQVPKSLSGQGAPLPVALTGMITHGREPGVYAHFTLGSFWNGDPDATTSSLAKCFRELETYDGDKTGDIFKGLSESSSRPIFQALLHLEAFFKGYLEPKNLSTDSFRGDIPTHRTPSTAATDVPTPEEDQSQDGVEVVNPGAGEAPDAGLFEFLGEDLQQESPRPVHSGDATVPRQAGDPPQPRQAGDPPPTFKILPKHLTLQLDNSGKDNKNQTVMAFCSQLVARGVFETITMSFLMVGHTHEDVDAFFSKVSRQIIGKEVTTLPALMAETWQSEAIHPVPRILDEVAAYKQYLKAANVKHIEGHSKPQAFLFSMKDNIPVFQYRTNLKDPWYPPNGRCLWARDPLTNAAIVPEGEPFAKCITDEWSKLADVCPYLGKFIDWVRMGCVDESSVHYQERFPLVSHWERIKQALSQDLRLVGEGISPLRLQDGFWPKSNHGTGIKVIIGSSSPLPRDPPINPEMVDLQNEIIEEMAEQAVPFVGTRSEKEKERWLPLKDIQEGHFVILRPNEDWERTNGKGKFWLVRSQSLVDPNHEVECEDGALQEFSPMFKMQWWRPKHARINIDDKERYQRILLPTKTWEIDPGFVTSHWQYASTAIFGWKSQKHEDNIAKGLKIPPSILTKIKDYLKAMEDSELGEDAMVASVSGVDRIGTRGSRGQGN